MNPAWILDGFALLLGLCVGSFLNVCIARMPEDRSVVHPPSHCPACGSGIRWYDNVPVLSWLLLRARCRDCGTPISAVYPLVELATGLLVLLTWRTVVPDVTALDLAHALAFAWYTAFVAMLVAITFIDLRHCIIPDEFSIYAVPFGVGGAALIHWLDPSLAPSWQSSVLGAAAGAGILLLPAALYWLVRRSPGMAIGDVMGWGDVKLMAMIGSFLGVLPAIPAALIIGAMSGSAVGIVHAVASGRGLRTGMPFGPFLALGAVVYLFFGDIILRRLFLGLPALAM